MDRKQLLRIWLGMCVESSVRDGPALEDAFLGHIEAIYDADDYSAAGKLSEQTLNRLAQKDLTEAEKIALFCLDRGIRVLTPEDELFPRRLSVTPDRPVVLYAKGNLTDLSDRLCVAVVGTRKMSDYGARCAYGIAFDLAKAGAVIVSGMALGVDGTAHRAALDAGGYTVAVLGCGLDRAYPAEHHFLMDEIENSGCVLSEYRPFTPPLKWNFPRRNRIISGLCQGTLVVEAPAKSGALNTASHAAQQHRRIYAVPGKIGEGTAEGTNELLKSGAVTVSSGKEIIADFAGRYDTVDETRIPSPPEVKITVSTPAPVKSQSPAAARNEGTVRQEQEIPAAKPVDTEGLDSDETAVMTCFSSGKARSVDELVAETGLPVSSVLSALTILEIYGRIISLPGEKYIAE